jgi:transcriptional regulator with XRE-family HTH domain
VTTPEPPPEAKLIARLRGEMFPAVSMREAARRAGFSVATWTQIEQGYRKVTALLTIPITGTAEKVARMALVVSATPAQLREAGRSDAAAILKKLIDAGPDPEAQVIEKIRASGDFTERQKRLLIDLVQRETELARNSTLVVVWRKPSVCV